MIQWMRSIARHQPKVPLLNASCTTMLALAVCIAMAFACNKRNESRAPADHSDASDAIAKSESHPGGGHCQLVKKAVEPTQGDAPQVDVIAQGLEVPWGIAFLPGGDMLVTERPGRLRRIRGGRLEQQPIATWDIDPAGEGGLLGVALDPAFATNSTFFVYVTRDEGNRTVNRVERWKLDANAGQAAPNGVILDGIPAARFHNGGRIRTGSDGMLYIGTGDSSEPSLSQTRESLAGKLLRIQPNGNIPKDNPWPNVAAVLTGIRNTQGFDWIDTKRLVVTDHGPSGELGRTGHDEVSVVDVGANLGWPSIYGCETGKGMVTPSITWERAVPPGGAAYYKGDAIPRWKNSLLIGVLGDKHLHRVTFDPKNPRKISSHEIHFHGDPPAGYGRLREVIQGPDGALYITTSNCDGRGTCPPQKDQVLRLSG